MISNNIKARFDQRDAQFEVRACFIYPGLPTTPNSMISKANSKTLVATSLSTLADILQSKIST